MDPSAEFRAPEITPVKSEVITPHKITIAILIREYAQFRFTADFKCNEDAVFKAKFRRDFAVLILKLLQSPDLSLTELQNIFTSSHYTLHKGVIESFNETLQNVYENGTGVILDIFDGLSQLMAPNDTVSTLSQTISISRSSIIGYFLRRFIVNFDTLTFSEVTNVFLTFKAYYEKWKSTSSSQLTVVTSPPPEEVWRSSSGAQWSRRQAELFIATQAALLTDNEEKALPPAELQDKISNLLKSNPSLSEAHFLSYMNCLRLKEFCGAVDSLYHCFDRRTTFDKKTAPEKKIAVHRFAALNLAILHYSFGHKEEALASLKEAIKVSQSINDHVCLQHALAWLNRLTDTNKNELIVHSLVKSSELTISYTTLLGLQTFVKYGNLDQTHLFFEALIKVDVINAQNSLHHLVSNSYALKAALWQLYGKSEMSSLWSQLLLHLNIDSSRAFYSEGFVLAVCNISNHLLAQGEYSLVNAVLAYIKEKFSNPPNSHIWMLCENLFVFTRALHHENFTEAESAAQKMLVLNKWEGYLRLAELYLHKQDYSEADRFVGVVFERYKNSNKHKLKVHYFVRATILLAEIQFACCYPEKVAPGIVTLLNDCLIETLKYKLNYYSYLIYMHLANIQLCLGMSTQAREILEKSLVQILAHCGNFDRGRAMLLFVKCTIAEAHCGRVKSSVERRRVLVRAVGMLEKVKENFMAVEAFSRVKDVLYFQAQIYDVLGMKNERNGCSREFRLVDEEHTTKNFYTLVKFL